VIRAGAPAVLAEYLEFSMSYFDEYDTTEEHERRIVRCTSCQARIIFLPTPNGKKMPVDADTVEPDDTEYEPETHVSHFVTCPTAFKHRKPK
jgi:hypothetical protein